MAITSGTLLRARYTRPGGTKKTFKNAVTMTETFTTSGRTLIHKDNPGNHEESLPDGNGGSLTVNFFHEDAETYADLLAARAAAEVITFEISTLVVGEEKTTYTGWINNLTRTAQVRDNVSASVAFTLVSEAVLATVTA